MSPPLASWMVVAVALIVAETLVVYLLRRVAPEISVPRRCWFLLRPAVRGFHCLRSAGAAATRIVLGVAVGVCSVAALGWSRSIREGRASAVER
jgi:hypothetical protein